MTPHDRWLEPDDEPEECETCGGEGAVGNILNAEPCPECGGLTDAERRQKAFDDFDPPDAEFGE